jgi:protein SCO1/2
MWRCLSSCLLALAASTAMASHAAVPPERDEQLIRASQAVIGRTVSDWPLTDQAGRSLSMAGLRGKPLVVSFVYTGCFQVCPATTQFLARAVRAARDALGADAFRVLTIGFNQPFDTPEALAAFARKQGVDAADWLFVAPREADVGPLLAEFGMTVEPTTAGFDHVIQVTIVDADGKVHRQVYGDAFELPLFVGPLKELQSGRAGTRITVADVWQKVRLYCTVYDPTSGKYKFNYSLFVELFAGLTFLGALATFALRELRRHAVARRAPASSPRG